jgi:hypothetical protein
MNTADSGFVRVGTLNLWGRQGAWGARRSVLVDGLRTLRPDLMAFQEAITGEGCRLGAGCQLAWLAPDHGALEPTLPARR